MSALTKSVGSSPIENKNASDKSEALERRDSGVPAIHAGPSENGNKNTLLQKQGSGAGDGIRTRDICLGKAALYH